MTAAATTADSVLTLFPGRDVALSNNIAVVYPMGVKHLRKFSHELSAALAMLASEGAGMEGEDGSGIFAKLAPFAMQHLLDLIEECTKVEDAQGHPVALEDLPHWDFPPIIIGWLEESFGEEKKWRPWVQAIESLVHKVTKRKISISEIWSKVSSGQDTDETTSSTSSK